MLLWLNCKKKKLKMKTKSCFVIFMSAIIFSIILNDANAHKDEITSNGASQATEQIQKVEDEKIIKERQSLFNHFNGLFEMIDKLRGKNRPPTALFKYFQDQYKNKEINLLEFKNTIANVLKAYYKAYFNVDKLKEKEDNADENTTYDEKVRETEQAKTDDTEINQEQEDYQESLTFDIADLILATIIEIKEDNNCSASIVSDEKSTTRKYLGLIFLVIRGTIEREKSEKDFKEACESKSTDKPEDKHNEK